MVNNQFNLTNGLFVSSFVGLPLQVRAIGSEVFRRKPGYQTWHEPEMSRDASLVRSCAVNEKWPVIEFPSVSGSG